MLYIAIFADHFLKFKATKWFRSKHPKLKVADVRGGSRLSGVVTGKGENDKEEMDGWVARVSSGSGYLSRASCLPEWSGLEPSGAPFT